MEKSRHSICCRECRYFQAQFETKVKKTSFAFLPPSAEAQARQWRLANDARTPMGTLSPTVNLYWHSRIESTPQHQCWIKILRHRNEKQGRKMLEVSVSSKVQVTVGVAISRWHCVQVVFYGTWKNKMCSQKRLELQVAQKLTIVYCIQNDRWLKRIINANHVLNHASVTTDWQSPQCIPR